MPTSELPHVSAAELRQQALTFLDQARTVLINPDYDERAAAIETRRCVALVDLAMKCLLTDDLTGTNDEP